jgi:hypothetical protein
MSHQRTLLLAASLLMGCSPQSESLLDLTSAMQLSVSRNVPGDHPTIQDALWAAGPEDVIYVAAGTYAEDVVLPGSLWLVGEGMGATVIHGHVEIVGGQAGIANLGILGTDDAAATDCGVQVPADTSVWMHSVGVGGWAVGVCLEPGESAPYGWPAIERSNLINNGFGVLAYEGEVTLVNNYISNSQASGVFAHDGVRATIINNTFVGGGQSAGATERDAAISLGSGVGSVVRNNTITSATSGIHCDGCGADFDHNNLWNNGTDHATAESASSTDLAADPLFTDAAAGEYTITAYSPLVDAGSDVGAPGNDVNGELRPSGLGIDIGADEWMQVDGGLRLHEVMANPLSESTGEFVELWNTGSADVDLAGLILDDGDSTDVIEAFEGGGTVLPAGGFAVIVDRGYAQQYSIPAAALVVTVGNATLGNGLSTSDPITLRDAAGVAIDAWTTPSNPGNGVSFERVDGEWLASVCVSGSSPGAAACEAPAQDDPVEPSTLVITEVLANAEHEGSGEFVELWNAGGGDVELAGLIVADERLSTGALSSDVLVAFDGGPTVLGAGERALVVDPDYAGQYDLPTGVVRVTTSDATIGNGLSNSGDAVLLFEADGVTAIDSFRFPADHGDGVSHERIDLDADDSEDNWGASLCVEGHSAGLPSCTADEPEAADAGLLISEVLANPLNERTGEFVEVFNAGAEPVDLATLLISDGDAIDEVVAFEGGATVVQPGDYAVLVDVDYAGQHGIPAGVTVVTVDDAAIGTGLASSSDEVVWLEADGTTVVASYSFPFNPGNGFSVERAVLDGGDVETNWVSFDCGPSAGEGGCSAR